MRGAIAVEKQSLPLLSRTYDGACSPALQARIPSPSRRSAWWKDCVRDQPAFSFDSAPNLVAVRQNLYLARLSRPIGLTIAQIRSAKLACLRQPRVSVACTSIREVFPLLVDRQAFRSPRNNTRNPNCVVVFHLQS